MPGTPLKALYRVLDRWKALFQTTRAPLGPEQLAGLFGELTVLVRLLEEDSSAYRLWRGPGGHRHDFSADGTAVEVKASVGVDGSCVRIHGLEQLEAPSGGCLQLVWYRLERSSDRGESLPELIERALELVDDEGALHHLLAAVGYHSSDVGLYRDIRFSAAEERWYGVDAVFPKLTSNDLTAAGIPITVADVSYTIDLSHEPPTPLGSDRVNEHLTSMLRESS